MTDEHGTAFFDLRAEDFPFTIDFIDKATDEVFHTITVEGPGALTIPSGADYGVAEVSVRIKYASGKVVSA